MVTYFIINDMAANTLKIIVIKNIVYPEQIIQVAVCGAISLTLAEETVFQRGG